jgi:hypothetical protein
MHQAARLPSDSAIFLMPIYQDRTGERRRRWTARQLVATGAGANLHQLGGHRRPGVVGGYVVSGERYRPRHCRILMQQEPDIAGIPGYLFDYGAIQRFHLQNIPPPHTTCIARKACWNSTCGRSWRDSR